MNASSVRAALLALLALPVIGVVLSLLWLLAGGGPIYIVRGSLTWAPALITLLISLALAPLLGATVLLQRGVERARQEARDEHSQRRRRLMARLDHELKNPIQGIRAALADEPSERQRHSIETQAGRLTGLLGDLRKISEVEHTQLELDQVDITALVEEVVASSQELPGGLERRFTVSLPRAPRPLPPVTADSDLLFLALSNLVGNAVKYSQPGDAIEVRGRAEDGFVVLEVADTGRGIPADEVELVWNELERSREARGTEGSGLGLSMVRAIVERHGGRASLESWHGEGSTVTVRLPAAPPSF